MTVGVAVRVPGAGAVLVCDGRVVRGGEIESDSEKKFVICGPTIVLVAGTVGLLWRKLQEKPPKNFKTFRNEVAEHGDETDWLAYDKTNGRLWSGDVQVPGAFATLGSGGSLAMGALEVLPLPKNLEEARLMATKAIRIACKRHTECGGRLRTIIVANRKPIEVR